VLIVSGLALGIDSIAHRAALEAGQPTIAVLANGVDKPYPASHAGLAKQIIEADGALISEYKPGTPPLPHQFLARNRIVSGLSQAVVVIEAATRSGTLSTVNHALDQGREVFAVPGNITSPLSAGCNQLIKQGATPVTSAQDIIEVVAPELSSPQTKKPLGDTPAEQVILEFLQSGLRDGDKLLSKSKLETSEFNQTVTLLEIKGHIRSIGANQWSLR
jgi:DNA processing protein